MLTLRQPTEQSLDHPQDTPGDRRRALGDLCHSVLDQPRTDLGHREVAPERRQLPVDEAGGLTKLPLLATRPKPLLGANGEDVLGSCPSCTLDLVTLPTILDLRIDALRDQAVPCLGDLPGF